MYISKRSLLLVAGVVWAFASGMLITKGAIWVFGVADQPLVRLGVSILIGIPFYRLLFIRIAGKHIHRITNLDRERPSALSFFDTKGYVMMSSMIMLGMILRNLDFINKDHLFTFYIGMGIPLLFSSIRFYQAWLAYPNHGKK
ncbi:MAG TPA: hypothetical protein DCY35_02375 [Prolixibacteraceae bacterium]|nr:hypothetical protein [Prolixibacteraceae bacterium]